MKPKYIIVAVFVLLVTIICYLSLFSNRKSFNPFPPEPTKQDIENAKKLSKDKCPCWDGVNNQCLPQSACI